MTIFGIYTHRSTLLLAISEWLVLCLLLLVAISTRSIFIKPQDLDLFRDGVVLSASWSGLLVALMFSMGLYEPDARSSVRTLLTRLGVVFGFAALLALALVDKLMPMNNLSTPIVASMLLGVPLVVGLRYAAVRASGFSGFASRVLILGAGRQAGMLTEAVSADAAKRIVGYLVDARPAAVKLAVGGDLSPRQGGSVEIAEDRIVQPQGSLVETVRSLQVDQVVIALDERRGAMPVEELLQCRMEGVEVLDHTTYLERETGRVDLNNLYPSWLIFSGGFRSNRLFRVSKRLFDIVVSASFLIATLPLCLLTALLIKLDSAGPVFYRQERVGQNGRNFWLLKFRSMRTDAEAAGPRWASRNDPRITRIGAFIRKTRIDEIPQVLNVLKGDMSFVGPRPERPFFVEDLARSIKYYNDRHRVKPGITGWAQIKAPYGASLDDAREKLTYDLYYMKHQSVMLDLLILLQTARVVIFQQGAR